MKSLRTQLTTHLLLGGMLLLGSAGFALHWQVRRALTAEFDEALRATAQSLVALTEAKHGRISLELEGGTMPQFERRNGPEVFLLRAVDGREIERSRSLGQAILPLRAGTLEKPEVFDVAFSERTLRCAGLRFRPQQEDQEGSTREEKQDAVLVIGRDRAGLDHPLSALRASSLLVGFGALAILAALVRWEVRKGLAPLVALGERVASVDAASLATRFPADALPAELHPIAERLNELLARLEAAFARERRFTATAAHELRTPLAELRALSEVNLLTKPTEFEVTESWRDALAISLRMESLALHLLELARVEDPALVVHPEPVSLAEAFALAWRPWSARAAQRDVALDVRIPPGLTVHTDPTLLGVVLGNLCANAADHTPSQTPFVVRAFNSAGRVTMTFCNAAGDLTEGEIPQLSERFWRKESARSETHHHGLGLALVAEYAALLGGTLTTSLRQDHVLEFAVILPTPV